MPCLKTSAGKGTGNCTLCCASGNLTLLPVAVCREALQSSAWIKNIGILQRSPPSLSAMLLLNFGYRVKQVESNFQFIVPELSSHGIREVGYSLFKHYLPSSTWLAHDSIALWTADHTHQLSQLTMKSRCGSPRIVGWVHHKQFFSLGRQCLCEKGRS